MHNWISLAPVLNLRSPEQTITQRLLSNNINRPQQWQTMKKQLFIFGYLVPAFLLISYPLQSVAKDLTIEPSLTTRIIYDDNLDFDDKDEIDDFGANATPGLTLNYNTVLGETSLYGELDIIKYFNETDFDRTNQLYGFDGRYRLFPRWTFTGDFEYRRDETIDSQLRDTGRVSQRNRQTTYEGGGGVFYLLTELTDIGFTTDYRKRDYGSNDDSGYDRYIFSLPFTKRFTNQRDTLTLEPAHTIFNSDGEEDAKDYRFVVGWERQISETLTFQLNSGIRYTDIENEDGKNDDSWGYLGKFSLRKTGETFSGDITASRDIRANTDAEIVEINRLILRVDKQLRERLGFRFYGAGYYSNTESNQAASDRVIYFELKPSGYFLLTENFSLDLVYTYQRGKELNEPGNTVTQRNRVWLGLTLKFPKKWE